MSERLVHHLREARATEAALQQTLKVHIAATPAGAHRGRLEQHLVETRRHEQRLARRIGELDARGADPVRQALSLISGTVGFGMGVARGATRAMLSLVGLPLSFLLAADEQVEDTVLRNVRAEAASEALEVATYNVIERLAREEGDEITAELAAQIRTDEERMLAYLLDGEEDRARADRAPERGAEEEPEPPPPPVAERARNGHERVEARPPAPPAHVSEEPELVAEFAEEGAEEEAGAEIEIEEPWDGYDRMRSAEIQQRLEYASDEVAAVVRLYEAAGKNRQTVLRAADHRLRSPNT